MLVQQGIDPVTAQHKAMAMIYGTVQQQSTLLGYVNAFVVLSWLMLCLVPLPFIMRRPKPGEARSGMAH
jgi:DHA2 family multidrug resistance protein